MRPGPVRATLLLWAVISVAGAEPMQLLDRGVAKTAVDGMQDSGVLSHDGRRVAFRSVASLVAQDTEGRPDVFLLDRSVDRTWRLSEVAATGRGHGAAVISAPQISGDGRHIAFRLAALESLAEAQGDGLLLVDIDPDGDGVLGERAGWRTAVVTRPGSNLPVRPNSDRFELSRDGRFLLFSTTEALVDADHDGVSDVYLLDRDADRDGVFDQADGTEVHLVSGRADDSVTVGRLSADGAWVMFETNAPLETRDINSTTDVYAWERPTGAVALVSTSVAGGGGNGTSRIGGVSHDGRWVALSTTATNIVARDDNGAVRDAVLLDRIGDQRWLASIAAYAGGADAPSQAVGMDGEGRRLYFDSTADNLAHQLVRNRDTGAWAYEFDREHGTLRSLGVSSGRYTNEYGATFESISADGWTALTSLHAAPGSADGANHLLLFDTRPALTIDAPDFSNHKFSLTEQYGWPMELQLVTSVSATGVELFVSLPSGMTLSRPPSHPDCGLQPGLVVCHFPRRDSNWPLSLRFDLVAARVGDYLLEAQVFAHQELQRTGLETARSTFRIRSGPDASVAIQGPHVALAKKPVRGSLSIENEGVDAAQDVRVTFEAPRGAKFKRFSLAKGDCGKKPPKKAPFTCVIPSMSPHESVSASFELQAGKPGTLTQTVSVSIAGDTNPGNDRASMTVDIRR